MRRSFICLVSITTLTLFALACGGSAGSDPLDPNGFGKGDDTVYIDSTWTKVVPGEDVELWVKRVDLVPKLVEKYSPVLVSGCLAAQPAAQKVQYSEKEPESRARQVTAKLNEERVYDLGLRRDYDNPNVQFGDPNRLSEIFKLKVDGEVNSAADTNLQATAGDIEANMVGGFFRQTHRVKHVALVAAKVGKDAFLIGEVMVDDYLFEADFQTAAKCEELKSKLTAVGEEGEVIVSEINSTVVKKEAPVMSTECWKAEETAEKEVHYAENIAAVEYARSVSYDGYSTERAEQFGLPLDPKELKLNFTTFFGVAPSEKVSSHGNTTLNALKDKVPAGMVGAYYRQTVVTEKKGTLKTKHQGKDVVLGAVTLTDYDFEAQFVVAKTCAELKTSLKVFPEETK